MMHENPFHMPDWFVPATYYYLWDDDTLIGEFRIRHHLTEALRMGAGHIGYSIKKEFRGKGYGTKGLALTLGLARKLIPEDDIYLRVLKENTPSFNTAYDFEKGDEYGIGSVQERFDLFKRCEKEGVGISVMKPFFAGQLLTADQSPFGVALSHNQCLQYAIDRPGVLVAVPGVQTMGHLDQVLKFLTATNEEKDYSVIGTFTADTISGTCVYCNHCQPCPAGIDIGLVNKYYDLAQAGDEIAANHYTKLSVKADACLHCGHCESCCPFGVKQESRMEEINRYFNP